jgi:pimeloyl-ACP methyl ester carboxylesterase
MPTIRVNDIEIDYAERGERDAAAIVLIRGLGTQRIQWPESLLAGLVEHGLRVITPDNRDVGGSTKFEEAGAPDMAALGKAIAKGHSSSLPYGVADMAADVVGLLDALEIERAHVLGISMGGMIVQHLAGTHGERLHSMTSVMSSSGAPGLPAATPAAMAALTSRPDDPSSRESVIENSVRTQEVIGSPGYPTTEADLREAAGRAYDRCYCPDGVSRQMAAVMGDAARHRLLSRIRVPTLVIHGEADPLIPLACGVDTAERIEGARLETIAGMGHDIPVALVPTLLEMLADHVARAGR